jgi:hypothetical protein
MPTFPTNATFTARLQLPRPGLDDPADGPDGFNDLTDVLDPITSVYAQGTQAARPAAGVAGRFYWATDTRALYYDDGTAWRSGAGNAAVGASLPILDVGVAGQIRAGRQLTVADFTSLGLSQPVGLFNLSDLTNLGSAATALANKGAVPFAAGINGLATTAAQFTGSTGQALYIVDSGASDPFRIRTGSWGCWQRTAKRGTQQSLITKSMSGSRSWELFANANNVAQGVVWSDGTSNLAQPAGVSDICDDRWHHVITTHDGTTVRLYVDGALEATAALPYTAWQSAGPINIGAMFADAGTAATSPHFGRVDEAFVTSDVLTEDQIRCLYAAKLTHTLGVTPTAVRLNVHRRRKGAALAVTDFTTQPLRLYNLTNGVGADEGSNGVALTGDAQTGITVVAGADGGSRGAQSFATSGHVGNQATDAGLPSALAARSYGCWFKTSTTAGNNGVISWGTPTTAHCLIYLSSGVLNCNSGNDAIAGPFAGDGQWHFAVAVEDNAAGDQVRRKLYLDGRLVGGSTVLTSITLAGANRFRIGAQADGSIPFTGQIDGVFVTGYALTAADVAALYSKSSQDLGASPKEPGAHVERVDSSSILFIGDTLESQHTVDLAVVA